MPVSRQETVSSLSKYRKLHPEGFLPPSERRVVKASEDLKAGLLARVDAVSTETYKIVNHEKGEKDVLTEIWDDAQVREYNGELAFAHLEEIEAAIEKKRKVIRAFLNGD